MLFERSIVDILMTVFPTVLLLELPLYGLCWTGALLHRFRSKKPSSPSRYLPRVSCIVTCYSEGREVGEAVRTLIEQTYSGLIEILVMVDGAVQNSVTYRAARAWRAYALNYPNRVLKVIPKRTRGGRVSSLNTGRHFATGEVVLALDGDTCFDNDMVWQITRPFEDPAVAGVSGTLRVRNAKAGLAARMQALEYMISIQLAKTGLSQFNVVNNISGAFGAFRRKILDIVGGWDAGTAEDLDLTLRIKKRFATSAPPLRIVHQPLAIGHTDAPADWKAFFKQRLRWDGDLYYLYVRKHWTGLRPGLLGWRNFIVVMWTGIYFQLLMPFVIICSTLYLIWALPWTTLLALAALTYGFYLLVTLALFSTYFLILSERKRADSAYFKFVLLFPLFAFATRVWSAYATLAEIVTRQHLDSAMAPYWVLSRTRF